jgi:hypothetical protein
MIRYRCVAKTLSLLLSLAAFAGGLQADHQHSVHAILPGIMPASEQVACSRESLCIEIGSDWKHAAVTIMYWLDTRNAANDTVYLSPPLDQSGVSIDSALLSYAQRPLEALLDSGDSTLGAFSSWRLPDDASGATRIALQYRMDLPAGDPFAWRFRYGAAAAGAWTPPGARYAAAVDFSRLGSSDTALPPICNLNFILPSREAVAFNETRASWKYEGPLPDSGIQIQIGTRWGAVRRPDLMHYKTTLSVDSRLHESYLRAARRYLRYVSTPFMIDQYLSSLEPEQLYFLRHFIYAMHGYAFQSESITRYFLALQDQIAVDGRKGAWYSAARDRGFRNPEPYIAGIIENTRELQREKAGFPHYRADYGWIIYNYIHFDRYPARVRERFLDELIDDELHFMYYQLFARAGFRFDVRKRASFFEQWEEKGALEYGFGRWFTRARERGYQGIGPENKALAEDIENKLEWMLE